MTPGLVSGLPAVSAIGEMAGRAFPDLTERAATAYDPLALPLQRWDPTFGIMALLAGRLLLLLLLAFDWATDPSHGTSPLSRPLASTETYCYSVSSPGAALKLCTLESMAGSAGLLARGLALPTLDHPSPRPMVPPPPIHNLIYVFLSIRR